MLGGNGPAGRPLGAPGESISPECGDQGTGLDAGGLMTLQFSRQIFRMSLHSAWQVRLQIRASEPRPKTLPQEERQARRHCLLAELHSTTQRANCRPVD